MITKKDSISSQHLTSINNIYRIHSHSLKVCWMEITFGKSEKMTCYSLYFFHILQLPSGITIYPRTGSDFSTPETFWTWLQFYIQSDAFQVTHSSSQMVLRMMRELDQLSRSLSLSVLPYPRPFLPPFLMMNKRLFFKLSST